MCSFFVKDEEIDKYPSQLVMDLLRFTGYLISKLFWFVSYEGRENLPAKNFGGFIICANHQTYIDPVWVCLPMRRRLRFMAYDKAFEWRFIGRFINYLGAFPVSMEVGGTIKAMKEALRALRANAGLVVFPEGAREFADGEFFPFKTGAVRIAMQTGVPILPVTITGGNRIWPQKQKYPRIFKRVTIRYHPLLTAIEDPELEPHENLDLWTEKLKNVIASAYQP